MQKMTFRIYGLLMILFFSFSITAQKKVLFEKFTNSFCGVCPNASLKIAQIVKDNPDVIWISHYKPIGFLDSPLDNEWSTAIWDRLNIPGVPTGMVDRVIYGNSIDIGSSAWESKILERLEEPETFTIDISKVQYDKEIRELKFKVDTRAFANVKPGSYRITTYIVEDSVRYQQSNYSNNIPGHPLEGLGDIMWDYKNMNVVRTILDHHWGTTDVIPTDPEANTSYDHEYTYTVPEEYKIANIQIVAMVSLFDMENNYPGEIQNATRRYLSADLLQDPPEMFSKELIVFPNPTSDLLNIEYDDGLDQIQILTTDGKMVSSSTLDVQKTVINISYLKAGVYLLKAVSGEEEIIKRFVVK